MQLKKAEYLNKNSEREGSKGLQNGKVRFSERVAVKEISYRNSNEVSKEGINPRLSIEQSESGLGKRNSIRQ